MKKAFELFLVLIIFYGVFSAFNQAAPVIFNEPNTFWVIIVSLLVAAALLLLYSGVIASNTKSKLTAKMTKTVSDLEHQVQEKEAEVQEKDSELKDAFKIKKAVEEEAEKMLSRE